MRSAVGGGEGTLDRPVGHLGAQRITGTVVVEWCAHETSSLSGVPGRIGQ